MEDLPTWSALLTKAQVDALREEQSIIGIWLLEMRWAFSRPKSGYLIEEASSWSLTTVLFVRRVHKVSGCECCMHPNECRAHAWGVLQTCCGRCKHAGERCMHKGECHLSADEHCLRAAECCMDAVLRAGHPESGVSGRVLSNEYGERDFVKTSSLAISAAGRTR